MPRVNAYSAYNPGVRRNLINEAWKHYQNHEASLEIKKEVLKSLEKFPENIVERVNSLTESFKFILSNQANLPDSFFVLKNPFLQELLDNLILVNEYHYAKAQDLVCSSASGSLKPPNSFLYLLRLKVNRCRFLPFSAKDDFTSELVISLREQVESDFEKIRALDPSCDEAYSAMSSFFYIIGANYRALNMIMEARRLNPKNSKYIHQYKLVATALTLARELS